MRLRLALLVVLGCVAAPVEAWPVLAGARATPVGACYPDHREVSLWWLAPSLPVIKEVDGLPSVSLTQYRYTGTRATGDQGTFWGRSTLQLALRFPGRAERLARARTFLGPGNQVREITATDIAAEIVFTPVEGGGDSRPLGAARVSEGEPPSGDAGTVWEERSFTLSLSPESTRVVWEAFQRGAVALSVSVIASAPAFAMAPARGEGDASPPAVPLAVGAVPVTVDPVRHPAFVKHLDLDATMAAGYTFLEVACNDLAEGLGFSDLAMVIVTVAARAVNGDGVTEELRFDGRMPALQSVRFDRAVRLDLGYQVTVHRVYASGRRDSDGPRSAEVWSGFLDVSSSLPAGSSKLDPRLLY